PAGDVVTAMRRPCWYAVTLRRKMTATWRKSTSVGCETRTRVARHRGEEWGDAGIVRALRRQHGTPGAEEQEVHLGARGLRRGPVVGTEGSRTPGAGTAGASPSSRDRRPASAASWRSTSPHAVRAS